MLTVPLRSLLTRTLGEAPNRRFVVQWTSLGVNGLEGDKLGTVQVGTRLSWSVRNLVNHCGACCGC